MRIERVVWSWTKERRRVSIVSSIITANRIANIIGNVSLETKSMTLLGVYNRPTASSAQMTWSLGQSHPASTATGAAAGIINC